MKKHLKVAFNLPLYGTYDYLLPEDISDINIGMRVEASFGKKKLIGIISEIKNAQKSQNKSYKLKTINERRQALVANTSLSYKPLVGFNLKR